MCPRPYILLLKDLSFPCRVIFMSMLSMSRYTLIMNFGASYTSVCVHAQFYLQGRLNRELHIVVLTYSTFNNLQCYSVHVVSCLYPISVFMLHS